jgi:hypothetical protein
MFQCIQTAAAYENTSLVGLDQIWEVQPKARLGEQFWVKDCSGQSLLKVNHCNIL